MIHNIWIFFKNIRKSQYEIEEIPKSGIEIYRLKSDERLAMPLKPFIVYNWRQDFASIMFDTNGINSESITLIFEKDQIQDKQIFGISFPKDQSYLAIRIYNALLRNEKIFVINDNQEKEILPTETQREDFRITVFDFLRLVEMR